MWFLFVPRLLKGIIRCRLPGPPLSNQTLISALHTNGVTVAVGVREGWEARNVRFDVAWVSDRRRFHESGP
jgi:hypothetical protein